MLVFLMAQGPDVIPIPETTRTENFDENIKALEVEISKRDNEAIRKAIAGVEVQGARYPESLAKALFVDTVPLK